MAFYPLPPFRPMLPQRRVCQVDEAVLVSRLLVLPFQRINNVAGCSDIQGSPAVCLTQLSKILFIFHYIFSFS